MTSLLQDLQGSNPQDTQHTVIRPVKTGVTSSGACNSRTSATWSWVRCSMRCNFRRVAPIGSESASR